MAASNVDRAELAKFSDAAAHWWDMDGEFATLHRINPLRLGWIESICPLRQLKVLDVGCGGGILADSMARKGADVLGVDLAEKSLLVARLHALEAQTASVRYETVAAEDLALREPAAYDVVTCMEMLEHVPDPAAIVRACGQLVKPGGWAFFSTINRSPRSFLTAIAAAEYLLRIVPSGTHEYARFIRPSELATHCRAAGLDVLQTRGMVYNPITRRVWLSDDTGVNYLLAAQRPV